MHARLMMRNHCFFIILFFLQGGQQCWALWAFLAACPYTLFIDVISLFVDWANKDACCLLGGNKPQKVQKVIFILAKVIDLQQ